MRRERSDDRTELFLVLLAQPAALRHPPRVVYEHATLAHRIAARLGRLSETECNRPLSPREEAEKERKRGDLMGLLLPYVDGDPDRIMLDNDPRGFAVRILRLFHPDIRDRFASNTFGGEEHGYGIG